VSTAAAKIFRATKPLFFNAISNPLRAIVTDFDAPPFKINLE